MIIDIVNDKIKMIKNDKDITKSNSLKIYINSNKINKKIKTTIYCLNFSIKLKKYLSLKDYYIVYFRKLKKIDITCQLALNVNFDIKKLHIFINN